MEPMVTIPVKDYNALIDCALGHFINLKKVATTIKEVYQMEKSGRITSYGNIKVIPSVSRTCDELIEELDARQGNIPEAIKTWILKHMTPTPNEHQEH